eukprot:9221744-Karenia_brevis.AAC.1
MGEQQTMMQNTITSEQASIKVQMATMQDTVVNGLSMINGHKSGKRTSLTECKGAEKLEKLKDETNYTD